MDKSKGLTPSQLTLRARLGAYSLHAKYDSRETTQAARDAFLNRFEREVDPKFWLPVAERQRRSHAALRAHMTRLALASSLARAKSSKAN